MGNTLSSKKTKSKSEDKPTSSTESLENANVKSKSKKKKSIKDESNSQTGVKKKMSFSKRFQDKPTKKKKKRGKKAEKEGGECSDDANDKNKFPQIIISSPSDVEASLERELSKNASHAPLASQETPAELPTDDNLTEKTPTVTEKPAEVGKFTKNTSSNNSCNNSFEDIANPIPQLPVDNSTIITDENNEVSNGPKPDNIDPQNSDSNDSEPAVTASETVKTDSKVITANIGSLADIDMPSEVIEDDLKSSASEQIGQTSTEIDSFTVHPDVHLLVADIILKTLDNIKSSSRDLQKANNITSDSLPEPLQSTDKITVKVESAENIARISDSTTFGNESDIPISSEFDSTTIPSEVENTQTHSPLEIIVMPNDDVIYLKEVSNAERLAGSSTEKTRISSITHVTNDTDFIDTEETVSSKFQ